jgi:hypothetical protein
MEFEIISEIVKETVKNFINFEEYFNLDKYFGKN